MRNREPYWSRSVPKNTDSCLTEHIMMGYDFKLLNPTGKWRLVLHKEGRIMMEVQHKSWLFKHWESEENITYLCPEGVIYTSS